MCKKLFKFSLFIASISIVFSACKKDDNGQSSSNPLNGKTTAMFNATITYGTLTDIDGNVYKTVTIGTQTWMAENLRTTKYNDGTAIPIVTDNIAWVNLNTGAYCHYNNTINADTIATFGRLYNWYAVNTGRLAPDGWHLPTDEEWTTLITYLGGESIGGGKLKEAGTMHWIYSNEAATNETGFTALAGGYRIFDGTFSYIGENGSWWSATETDINLALAWHMTRYDSFANRFLYNKQPGLSVRCVKD